MELKDKIIKEKLPRHIAVIMDGNGRWAQRHGESRIFGHQNGVESVRDVVEGSGEIGVEYLTLYAFSTENWERPKKEVSALMELLVQTIRKETDRLDKNNVRLKAIGNLAGLPGNCHDELREAMEITKDNSGLTLVLALSYSSRWEIIEATKNLSQDVASGKISAAEIDQEKFSSYLVTNEIPDPELLIRTSGEKRISNFLLWQIAYSELYFTETLWPDFRKNHLFEAIIDYQKRERRFGKTSQQTQV